MAVAKQAKYRVIAEEIERRIESGVYTPASGFPTQEKLCLEFSTSRSNIHKVLKRLEGKGLIIRRKGKRTQLKGDGVKTMLFLYFPSKDVPPNEVRRNIRLKGISGFTNYQNLPVPLLLYSGIRRYAADNKFHLLIQVGEAFRQNIESILPQIDGIILSGDNIEEFYQTQLRNSNIPVCVIGAHHLMETDLVSADYYEGGSRAASTILAKGLTRPALLTLCHGEKIFTSLRMIQYAFVTYAEQHQLETAFLHTLQFDDLKNEGASVQALKEKIRQYNPDSIVYCGAVSFPFIRKIPSVRILPSIVVDYFDIINPEWNTEIIGFDAKKIGFMAAARLAERLRKPEQEPVRMLIPCVINKQNGVKARNSKN